ncbi:MAG: glycosyltransferase family 39 protein [Lentisphaeria bacterium]|nr:MAG: glycosyltransferase family 39 protein [Lentisphaeria bacterium]
MVNDRGEFYPKYPPLYPLLAAGMNAMLGPGGGFYATLWGAVLAAAGIFVLARFFLGPWYALLAAAAAVSSPVLSGLAVTKNSHTPSLALFVWGMVAFFAALTPKREQWFRILLAAVSGFLIAYCTGIRYTDFLLILIPAAAAFLFARKRRRRNLLIGLAAGAALPYGALALFHWHAYGAPWRSGYSLTDESSAFVPSFILDNLRVYVPEFFISVIGPLGAFALLFRRVRWRRLLFWLVWLLPTFVLYLMYYWAPRAAAPAQCGFWCR